MKAAIVTGGTKGIGRGVAECLLQRGYRVVVTYGHDDDGAACLEAGWTARGWKAEVLRIDHTCRADTYRLVDYVRKHVPVLHCMVCNAGITVRKPFTDTADADWDAVMEAAVNSHYILVRELFDCIAPDSRILFTGSLMALHPHATVLSYGVSKAAVHALARNLVKEFEGTGTTVNTIAPGFVETEWQRTKPEAVRQNIYRKTAVKRFACVDEVVKAFAFCLDNAFVNGSVIEVSGGYGFK